MTILGSFCRLSNRRPFNILTSYNSFPFSVPAPPSAPPSSDAGTRPCRGFYLARGPPSQRSRRDQRLGKCSGQVSLLPEDPMTLLPQNAWCASDPRMRGPLASGWNPFLPSQFSSSFFGKGFFNQTLHSRFSSSWSLLVFGSQRASLALELAHCSESVGVIPPSSLVFRGTHSVTSVPTFQQRREPSDLPYP